MLLVWGLNPYCVGRWSLRIMKVTVRSVAIGLNPYCVGRWSLRAEKPSVGKEFASLNPYCVGLWSLSGRNVVRTRRKKKKS